MLLSLLPTQVKPKMCSSFFIVTCSEMQAKLCLLIGVLLLVRRAAFLPFSYIRCGLQNILSSQGVSCPLPCVKSYHMLHCTEIWKLGLSTMGIMAMLSCSVQLSAPKCVGKCVNMRLVLKLFSYLLYHT